jgi:anti-sigma regulatory factor (Ser/Thr protein kinase)
VSRGFRHDALFYAGRDDFLAGTVPFIREGVGAGEPVLVAVPAARTALLIDALGADADAVQFADMEQLGRNPARIIPAWRRFVDDNCGPDRPVRGIGEPIWAQRSEAELVECHSHESLLNLAFDDGPAWQLLCPYDTTALAPDVVAAARCTHPAVVERGHATRSADYVPPELAPGPFQGPLSPIPPDAVELPFGRSEMGAVRLFTEVWGDDAALPYARLTDLVLAVNELACNSVRHAGGGGTLRAWREPDAIVCQVDDAGRIDHPLAGRERPDFVQSAGRGLWIANQVCDLVEIRSGPAGTSVRLHMALG